MAKATSRAATLGVKPGALSAKTKRKLEQAKKLIGEAGYLWFDVYSGLEFDLEQISEAIDRVMPVVDEAVSFLRAPPEDGEWHG